MADTKKDQNAREYEGATGVDGGDAPTAKRKGALNQRLEGGRTSVRKATERARAGASGALDAGARAVDQSPVTALAGAIAFGAVAAALIPATARELSTVGPLGQRLRALLDDAFKAAKTAGVQHFADKGFSGSALSGNLGQIAGSVITAALAASTAAGDSVRKRDRGGQGETGQPETAGKLRDDDGARPDAAIAQATTTQA